MLSKDSATSDALVPQTAASDGEDRDGAEAKNELKKKWPKFPTLFTCQECNAIANWTYVIHRDVNASRNMFKILMNMILDIDRPSHLSPDHNQEELNKQGKRKKQNKPKKEKKPKEVKPKKLKTETNNK